MRSAVIEAVTAAAKKNHQLGKRKKIKSSLQIIETYDIL